MVNWFLVFRVSAQENQSPVLPERMTGLFSSWNDKINNFFSLDKFLDGEKVDWGNWLREAENRGKTIKNSTTTEEVKQLGIKVAKENKDTFREIGQESKEFGVWLWSKFKVVAKSVFREVFGFLLDKTL